MTVFKVILVVIGVLYTLAAVAFGIYLARLFIAIDELLKD